MWRAQRRCAAVPLWLPAIGRAPFVKRSGALDSMALPVLFTHETDYIYTIPIPVWERQLADITAAIQSYRPISVTLDEAVRYVRATRTSRLAGCTIDPAEGGVTVWLTGSADVATMFYLFTEAEATLEFQLVTAPAFDGETSVTVQA